MADKKKERYRIYFRRDRYYIKRRWLWFWNNIESSVGMGNGTLYFPTAEAAKRWIDDDIKEDKERSEVDYEVYP